MEIERKFIVDRLPQGFADAPRDDVRQGYLCVAGDREVRLRSVSGRCTITVKSSGGLVREEYETAISEEQFDALWPATEARRIEKTRYRVDLGAHEASVDVYRGALGGLVVAEIEFDSKEAASRFGPPPWFGREVTDDGRYRNASLALAEAPDGPREESR